MINILFSFLLIFFNDVLAAENCTLKFCNGTSPTRDSVEKFCSERNDTYMIERCCISNETETIIGLDLSSCQIQHVDFSENNFTNLVIMDLRDNELSSLIPKDLIGLINLDYLYLPYWIFCPGGSKAWNETQSNTTYCYHQENPCAYLKISCTINGLCEHLGPGSAKCVCKPGHHGYKCMNEGEFPVSAFSISVTGATVVLSVALWFVVGRDPYKLR